MKNVVRLLAIAIALAIPTIATPAALAGCQAAGSGNPVYVDGAMKIIAGMQCTTNNGSHYQVRTYMQGDSSGSFSIKSGPQTKDYYSPCNGCTYLLSYYFPCSALTPQDIHVRSKIVVENMVSHTTDIGYSGSTTRPPNCQ